MENGLKRKVQEGPLEFEQRVRRTVFLDELAPQVTISILQSALAQFGKVVSIRLLNHPLDPLVSQGCALIEFVNEEQARRVAATTRKNLLMVGGMPRPVRARMATRYMFDSPDIERSNLQSSVAHDEQEEKQPEQPIKWKMSVLGSDDPTSVKAGKLRAVRGRHDAEMKMLHDKHEEQRAELHKRQEAFWEDEYKKLDIIVKAGKQHGVDELRAFFGMPPGQKL